MGGYLIMTLTVSILLRWMEKKMDGPAHFDLALADPLVPGEGMHRYQKNPKETNADYRSKTRQSSAEKVMQQSDVKEGKE